MNSVYDLVDIETLLLQNEVNFFDILWFVWPDPCVFGKLEDRTCLSGKYNLLADYLE